MFVVLLLRVMVLLLSPLRPSSGAYCTVSDDRVPQMVPDHSNFSKSEVSPTVTVFAPDRIGAWLSQRPHFFFRQNS